MENTIGSLLVLSVAVLWVCGERFTRRRLRERGEHEEAAARRGGLVASYVFAAAAVVLVVLSILTDLDLT
jgi:hypothetical protein